MHISLTGRLGAGKTKVGEYLRDRYGFEIHSTGSAIRKLAADSGMTALEFNREMTVNPEYDYMIDNETRRISIDRAADKILYDSRMAWHFAVQSFKVYLYVDTAISAKRILEDPTRGAVETYKDLDDAVTQINARMMEENRRYKKIYGIDHLDLANFDLVIDTAHRSVEEVGEIIMKEFAVYCENPDAYREKMLMD